MTARFYVKCPSCGKITLVRVQMGYIDHPIRVYCGYCKITLSGEFKNGKVDFGKYILIGEGIGDYVIQSSGELLTHALKIVKSESDTMLPPPFINSVMLIEKENLEKFKKRFTYILNYKKEIFPIVKIINEHYFNNNITLLIEQIHKVLPHKQFPASNKLEILRAVHVINNMFFMKVADNDFNNFTEELFNLLNKIMTSTTQQLFDIAVYFDSKKILSKWEKRIYQLRCLMVENLAKFMPVMWFDLYNQSLEKLENEYAITTVVFEEIESIYLKCYELLSDMLPLVIAYDNALLRNNYNILKPQSTMNNNVTTLDEYIKIQSKGTKIQYIDGSEPLEHIICDAFDNGIRNAIGHFDYEYEVYNPFKQTYRFYHKRNRKKYKTKSLITLCYETWKMYMAVLKFDEILYQTQKNNLVTKGYQLDVEIDNINNWGNA